MTRQCTLLGGEEPARFPLTVLSCVVLIGRFFPQRLILLMGYILSFRELLTSQVNHVPCFLMCWLLVNLWVGEDGITYPLSVFIMGFLGGSVVKHPPANAGDPGSIPGSGRSCCRRKWHPTSGFLPGKSHGQRSLVGYSPWRWKRVRCDLATKQQQNNNIYHTHTHTPCWALLKCTLL